MKITQLIKKIITAGSLLCLMASAAMALQIDPAIDAAIDSGDQNNTSVILAYINDNNLTGFQLSSDTLMYKAEVPDEVGSPIDEQGLLSDSYTTTFYNSSTDPKDATITYDGSGDFVDPSNAWLLVKDGFHDPAWYLFNLTALGWSAGTETLQLLNFWPGSGAISHVALYGGSVQDPSGSPNVPDSGATIALMGIALAGLGFLKRRR